MKQMIRNWTLLIALSLVLLTALPQTSSAATVDATSKASSALWQASADGQTVDALILLQQDTSLATQTQSFTQAEQRTYVYQTLYQHAERSQQALRIWLDQHGIPYRAFYVVNAIQARLTERDMQALVQRSDVQRIISNPEVYTDLPETESTFTTQQTNVVSYGITTINADDVWAQGITGEGIVIAGQDTGYDWDHEALINNYRGWDGNNASHDYNWHDAIHSSTGSCGADSPDPCDDHYHGTHTMGTMVGDENAAETIGVAPGAQWIGCRNMNAGVGTPATYIECFEFFMAPYPVGGTPAQGDTSKAPHIINNSWSCPLSEGCDAAHTALLEQVVENVRAAGIMVVVSATNRGASCDTITEPPATFDASYSIAATDSADQIASFSSRGLPGSMKPNLSAPGVNIQSSFPGDAYGTLSGTSMAAPHVAGATALLWSAYPDLIGDISTTEAILNSTAQPLYSTQCGDAADAIPNSVFGYGRLDIYAAVNANVGTLTGTVTSAGGAPLDGVTILAQPLSGYTHTMTTTADGIYQQLLPTGTYTLTASLPGYTSTSVTGIALGAGETITQNFTLNANVGTLTGTATSAEGMPLDGVTILAQPLNGYTHTMTTTADGIYQQLLPTGTYTLTASLPGYTSTSVTGIALGAGETITQNFTLNANVGTLTGTATSAEGMPLDGVTILAQPLSGYIHTMTTTADGIYQQLLPTGTYTLTASLPGYTSVSIVGVTIDAGETVTRNFTLTIPCQMIEGITLEHAPTPPLHGQASVYTATVSAGDTLITYTWAFTDTVVEGNPITQTLLWDIDVPTYTLSVTATNTCGSITGTQIIEVLAPQRVFLPVTLK